MKTKTKQVKRTPKPWPALLLKENEKEAVRAICGCKMARGIFGVEFHECSLHAAAPELLQSLKKTVQSLEFWFKQNNDLGGVDSLMMQNARAAIAKAEAA